jgi:2'-5' RNA ligase
MPRTFIAVSASLGLCSAAQKLVQRLKPVAGDVRWVAWENLHWTLQFLGEIKQLDVPDVCNAVTSAAAQIETFEIECRGAGAFPEIERPRTLWIGARAGADRMIALQAAIQKNLDRLGFRGEQRRYVPHLTIGRAGRNTAPHSLTEALAKLADYDAGTMLVDEVSVFASQLGAEGPVYDPLAHAPLA